MRSLSFFMTAACVLLLALAVPVYASAAPSPDDYSAVDQYVETVPGAGGPQAGSDEPSRRALPPGVAGLLETEGGNDSELLIELASSESLGAPQKRLSGARLEASPAWLSAAVGASGGSAPWLLAGLLVVTALAVTAAAYRHIGRR